MLNRAEISREAVKITTSVDVAYATKLLVLGQPEQRSESVWSTTAVDENGQSVTIFASQRECLAEAMVVVGRLNWARGYWAISESKLSELANAIEESW